MAVFTCRSRFSSIKYARLGCIWRFWAIWEHKHIAVFGSFITIISSPEIRQSWMKWLDMYTYMYVYVYEIIHIVYWLSSYRVWSSKHFDLALFFFFFSSLCVGADLLSRQETTWCKSENLLGSQNRNNIVVFAFETILSSLWNFQISHHM